MKHTKRLAILIGILCLCCLSAFAEEAQEAQVIKAFKTVDELIQKLGDDPAPVVDISVTSLSPEEIRGLQERYPQTVFRYRIRALKHHIAWDTEHLDLQYAKYQKLETLTEIMDFLPQLRELTTYGYVFTAEELDGLKAAYPQVETFNCKFHMAHHIIRTDLTAFCTRHASYTKDRHTEKDFAAFRHCPNLVALDVGHNAVKDLSFLDLLPKLRILIVADNDVTDLSPLARQTELVYLELIHNPITDVSPLANCKNLIDLHIGFCDIADITPLYGLEKLDRLWLAKNPIPQEQIDHIRALLPNATVNDTAVDAPTAEGWRQGHPRYLKIVEIFGNDKYIPFP